MRPIWKGSISFGLVNIPVSLLPAEQSGEELSFRLVDRRDNARVRYRRVNEATGEEVPWERCIKAYELEDGAVVPLDDEELRESVPVATQTVEIEAFTELSAIGYMHFARPYVLVPARRGEKGYVLLRETLARTGRVGIGRVVLRTREYLAALVPEGRALVLMLLRYRHELRSLDSFDLPGEDLGAVKISDKELAMAEQLVASLSTAWNPSDYRDSYRDRVLEWIDRRARAGAAALPPEPATRAGGEVLDMVELLRRSVEASRRARAERERPPRGGRRAG